MTKETEEQRKLKLKQYMTELAAVPAYKFTLCAATLDVYWMILGQYDSETLRKAFTAAISEALTECPTPARIRNYARALRAAAHPREDPIGEFTAAQKTDLEKTLEARLPTWRCNSNEANRRLS